MRFEKIAATIVLSILLAGCNRVQPIMNIEESPVVYDLTAKQVKLAILTAAQNKGWIVKDLSSNKLKAEVFVRSHYAVVHIPYNAKFYSIIYSNSSNLLHNGSNIHRNYNKWIILFNENIQQQLAVINAAK